MSAETWEEVRYHVLGQLPILNAKIDSVAAQLTEVDKKFEISMNVLTTKMMMVMAVGSGAIGIVIQIVTHLLGAK